MNQEKISEHAKENTSGKLLTIVNLKKTTGAFLVWVNEQARLPRRKIGPEIDSIHVWTTTGLGDSLMSGPAVMALQDIFPKVQVLCNWDIFGKIPRSECGMGLKYFSRAWGTHSLILRAHPASGLLIRLGSSTIVAPQEFPGPKDASLISEFRGPEALWHFEWASQFASMVGGRKIKMSFQEASDQYQKLLMGHGVVAQKEYDVVIHLGGRTMGGKFFQKRKELLHTLAEKYSIAVIGTSEDEYFDVGDDLRGKLSLRKLIGIIRDTKVGFIGHDSGPFQLAQWVAPKAVGLYGPSNSQRTFRDSGKNRLVTAKDSPPCMPCTSPRCFYRDPLKCLQVEVSDIVRALEN